MMGLDTYSLHGKLITDSPLCYWHSKGSSEDDQIFERHFITLKIGDTNSPNYYRWAPKSREHATWNYIDNCLIMFGGLNSKMLNDVWILNLEEFKWYEVKFDTTEQQPEPRYGHSAVIYKSKLYIYGGYRKYNKSFKIRDTFGDVYSFSTTTLKWDKLNWNGFLTFRRHHIAQVIGHHMLVHGGIDHQSKILDDIVLLDFDTRIWSEYQIKGMIVLYPTIIFKELNTLLKYLCIRI